MTILFPSSVRCMLLKLTRLETYKMKSSKFLLLLFSLALWSCSSEYGNEEIIQDVLSNNSDRLIKNFYEKKQTGTRRLHKNSRSLFEVSI